MTSEYVKLSPAESFYAHKNLLQSQLEIIMAMKQFKEYKKLRNQELNLKIKLKSKILEMNNLLKELEKTLPKTALKPQSAEEKLAQTEQEKEMLSLENELEKIKQKLEKL